MPVDLKTAKAIAALARLELAPGVPEGEAQDALGKLVGEFGKIVGYMDILGELDTSEVEPLYSPMLEPETPREDVPAKGDARLSDADDILGIAPELSGRFFVVPRVV
ncbi:MAG: Asp-tRNA(Asn)/Glu-tRNA(Gln) amidotransferase GatCAB subunit C [Deltaproteobacteria bacterium]|jgi:aspartyl-tRNA(Asn)/glutamyl-tRNA(Gln) amidotransferase subunit C|nr:Asp-tRNA(Asn)/Glu-tRNA(Gln) amidotransferase GatCAB subunit C [Deltaproteobacteria bacterium]